MSCHGCADTFGFWRREIGCPKCGFAYCKKCLRFKLEVEKENGDGKTTLIVCSKCYNMAQKPSPNDEDNSGWKTASQALRAIQVLEGMENPAKPPITLYRGSSNVRLAQLKKGLSVDDQKLVERLEELQSPGVRSHRRKSEQPEVELAIRLARLKGEEPPTAGPHTIDGKSIFLTQSAESDVELLDRLAKQVDLEKNYEHGVVSDIETRLAKLKGEAPDSTGPSHCKSVGPSASFDVADDKMEEEQVEDIIAKYVAEAALEAKVKEETEEGTTEDDLDSDAEDDDDDDLEFDKLCRICEEKRATIVCEECDGDIFCRKCFKEFHDELGETHKPGSIRRSEET